MVIQVENNVLHDSIEERMIIRIVIRNRLLDFFIIVAPIAKVGLNFPVLF